ncbi:hypothetical protein D3C84_812710 [compost metagenome]
MQFVALGVGEHALEGQFDVQGVFAFLLLAVVALDLYANAGQRDAFLLRVELQGQGLACAERCIEIVVRLRRRAFATGRCRDIGEEFVVIDLYAVAEAFGGNGIDGNGHGKPRQ